MTINNKDEALWPSIIRTKECVSLSISEVTKSKIAKELSKGKANEVS